ncbi:aminodeoxychorismate lyase [Rossellomorea aquimaris]|uniref:aminodeoxychorismate lyase n=1 Tax=Rossellomorea aquimaris TaxID=189382 RepID=UPI001CD1ED44|nr:aminodeoxychorismate lyase [Rossellomorea aquimaris]MCA1057286.1 aminodeoxychorismate lyase [Rossellomorea aquimaris]
MYIYMNGNIVHQSQASISPFDHGYLYGLGVFETFRTYDGHPFLLGDHVSRLKQGLGALAIEMDIHLDEVTEIVRTLLKKNGLEDAYCRLNVSGGPGEIGLRTTPYEQGTIILFQKALPAPSPLREKEGVVLRLRRSTPEIDVRLKSHHYLNNLAAKREIGPSADQEGIFLTADGYVCEGITSNIFWVKGGELYTPSVETGLLDGITRRFILASAQRLNIPVHEGLFKVSDLNSSDELFFTNSVQEIIPVNRVGDRCFPGKSGTYTRQLHEHYQRYVTHLDFIEEMEGGNQHAGDDYMR